ncbi:MAG: CBS domain-containing protein [Deltaproteobacteria bacterium]|nr:CBS domain-containing protein [Deltaproteobacteria bacterium]
MKYATISPMEVITTHTNADFDTLASMVAAKKLYPGAHLVFPGSLEKGLSSALEVLKLPYTFERAKDIDLTGITRLILVDIRHPARLGRFSEIISRKGLDIHIYDHHPFQEGDIEGTLEVVEPYGSTTTILTLILKEKGIGLSKEEATILMSGIYEDTGSLSFPSTKKEDFEAAAFLLSQGANLRTVTDLLKKELTPAEVFALNELMRSEVTYTMDGVDITIAAITLEGYEDDVAGLAHRLVAMERMRCLILLAEMDNRVHAVIRSAVAEVDAGEVARLLGGGGHPQAASATLKGMTLIQAREKVIGILQEKAAPTRAAGDIMSAPAITVPSGATLAEAGGLMRRYNINAAPVVKDNALIGVITKTVVDRAAYHGLGGENVSEYMTTDAQWVTAATPLWEIRRKVIARGQRILPVIKDGFVAGVITRTDLLKLLQEELLERPSQGKRKKSIRPLMKERLPVWAYELLKDAGWTAGRLGYQAYAVGGFVRDLILKRENLDMDIVIEGDGIVFAKEFAKEHGLEVKGFERFKTAVIKFPDGRKLDVATARLEYYERPGALPTVEMSSLKLDLYRRDFTINTLAVSLNPERFGELIDFFGGQNDIREKTVRVLHNLSFVEDPTRAFRAIRFSERFGFNIAGHTLNLIKNASRLSLLKEVSGARTLDELRNILEDEKAACAVERLSELGMLSFIHKKIKWDKKASRLFERTKETLHWHRLLYTGEGVEEWLVLFLALTDGLAQAELEELSKRLDLSGKKRQDVVVSKDDGLKAFNAINSGRVKRGSNIYEVLNKLPLPLLLYLMARAEKENTRKIMSSYISKLRRTETLLKGEDLKGMGVLEGLRIGELLAALLKKRLDGEITTREEEEEFVRGCLAKKNL